MADEKQLQAPLERIEVAELVDDLRALVVFLDGIDQQAFTIVVDGDLESTFAAFSSRAR